MYTNVHDIKKIELSDIKEQFSGSFVRDTRLILLRIQSKLSAMSTVCLKVSSESCLVCDIAMVDFSPKMYNPARIRVARYGVEMS